MSAADEPRRFLSVIALPPDWSREFAARALAQAGIMDEHQVRLRLSQNLPVIIGYLREGLASLGAHILIDAGGDAFAPSFDEVLALGPTLKIRDLDLSHGALEVVLWRGPEFRVPFEELSVLVRATVGGSEVKWGLEIGGGGPGMPPATKVDRSISYSEKLDIHTADGRVLQVDGDKFGYAVLGAGRGHSDKANTDALHAMLRHFAPEAVPDEFFRLWLPPVEARRMRLHDMKHNNDDPAFAFYSRWVALMYRHMGVAR